MSRRGSQEIAPPAHAAEKSAAVVALLSTTMARSAARSKTALASRNIKSNPYFESIAHNQGRQGVAAKKRVQTVVNCWLQLGRSFKIHMRTVQFTHTTRQSVINTIHNIFS
jgi:hypothetical protein